MLGATTRRRHGQHALGGSGVALLDQGVVVIVLPVDVAQLGTSPETFPRLFGTGFDAVNITLGVG